MASNIIGLAQCRIERKERLEKLNVVLKDSVDLESRKKIDRLRTSILDDLAKLMREEGTRSAIEWIEKAIEQLKVGVQP